MSVGRQIRVGVVALVVAATAGTVPASSARAQHLPWPAVKVPPASRDAIEHEAASYRRARDRFRAASRSEDALAELSDAEVARRRYERADALARKNRHREAAALFAQVRDSWVAALRRPAARRAVESLEKHVAQLEDSGELPFAKRPPRPAEGARVQPEPVPRALRELGRARDLYLAMADGSIEERELGEKAFENSVILYQYGYWPAAERRLHAIFEAGCNRYGLAKAAWKQLSNMAVARNDTEALERLSATIQARSCTFGRSASEQKPFPLDRGCPRVFRLRPECFEPLRDPHDKEPSANRAVGLIHCAEAHPDSRYVDNALYRAALDLERVGLPGRAVEVFERIVEMDVDDLTFVGARFRRAFNLERSYDFEAALRAYGQVLRDRRVAASEHPRVPAVRGGARLHRGLLLRKLRRFRRAATDFGRLARTGVDAEQRRRAQLELARTYSQAGRFAMAVRAFRRLLSQDNPGWRAELAAWRGILEAAGQLGRDELAREARRELVTVAEGAPVDLKMPHAAWVARARLHLLEEGPDGASCESPRARIDAIRVASGAVSDPVLDRAIASARNAGPERLSRCLDGDALREARPWLRLRGRHRIPDGQAAPPALEPAP